MPLSYLLIPYTQDRDQKFKVIDPYHPPQDRYRLRRWTLRIPNSDQLIPQTLELSSRFTFKVGPKFCALSVNYKGIQQAGLDDPDKFWSAGVLIYLRQAFADLALPALAPQLPKKSKLWALKKFQDIKGRSLEDSIEEILDL